MAPKWTAVRDQNLLLLIIKNVKVDFSDLAQKWKEQFPNEDFHPTAKAVSEHVAALKRKIGNSGAASASVAVHSTPATKTKTKTANSIPKTPTSKPKRSRAEMMSNEDDSEDEKMLDFDTPAPKRTTPSRHSVARKYKEEDTDTEVDDEVVMSARAAARTHQADSDPAASDGVVDSPVDVDGPRASIARSKKNPPKLDYFKDKDSEDAASEASDFEPLT